MQIGGIPLPTLGQRSRHSMGQQESATMVVVEVFASLIV